MKNALGELFVPIGMHFLYSRTNNNNNNNNNNTIIKRAKRLPLIFDTGLRTSSL